MFVPDPPIQQLQPQFGFRDPEDVEPRRYGASFCDEHGLERGAKKEKKDGGTSALTDAHGVILRDLGGKGLPDLLEGTDGLKL